MKHEQIISSSPSKRVSNEILIDSYSRTGNIWKTAKEVGICGQSVHERLKKLGIVRRINLWSTDDDKILLNEYKKYKEDNRLDELADRLCRTKQFICRKARELGLTDISNRKMSEKARARLSDATKKWIKEKGHPRGYLGLKHSDETRKKLSECSKKAWRNPDSRLNRKRIARGCQMLYIIARCVGVLKCFLFGGNIRWFLEVRNIHSNHLGRRRWQ